MTSLRSIAFVSLVAVAGFASAQTWDLSKGDIRSSLIDGTGVEYSAAEYGVRLLFDGTANDPLFINNVSINTGTNWNPLIDLATGFSYAGTTDNVFEFADYTLGTAITGDVNWDFYRMVNRYGEVDSSVEEGVYDFSIDILGGADELASSVLATFSLEIEVVDRIFATVSASTQASVNQGETFDVSATLFNNNDRDMITTTWYVAGFGLGGPGAAAADQLILDSFQGDWFDKTIIGGNSRTDSHTRWTVPNSAQLGNYSGNIGVIGGFHEGDRHDFRATPDVNVEVVPEPASMTALALGAAALLRRRKNG